jgi:hypothetical protein
MRNDTSNLPTFAPAALRASKVGTWETDFARDVTACDATVAAMFGIDPQDAAVGLPLARYAAAIHPDDRHLFSETVERVARTGGLFALEYRTVPRVGRLCWVMARGRYESDLATGNLYGRGIAIDITESKSTGHADDQLIYLPVPTGDSPLERAVSHALEAGAAVDQISGSEARTLRAKINDVLWVMGRMLARMIRFRH